MSRFTLLILTVSIISCLNNRNNPIIDTDEKQILNVTLDKVIGSDTTWRYHLKLPPPLIPVIAFTEKIDSAEYLKTIHWRDSAQNVLDTATLFVAVYKETDDIVDNYIDNIKNQIANNKNDTLFNDALLELCNQNLSKDTIDIRILEPRHNFKIFSADTAPIDRLRKIGSLRFSKIAFNKTRDKACIYTSFTCGELCGNGQVHFFMKENGKWTFLKTWELWVS